MLGRKKFDLDRTVRLVMSIAALGLGFYLLRVLSGALLPFVLASGVAYLLNPMVLLVESRFRHRGFAVVLSLLFLLLVGVGSFAFIYPKVVAEGRDFVILLKDLGEHSELAQRASKRLPEDLWGHVKMLLKDPTWKMWLQSDGADFLPGLVDKVMPGFLGMVRGTKSALLSLVGIVVVFLYLLFILLDYPRLQKSAKKMIPPPLKDGVLLFCREFDESLSRYFRAQALVASIVGVLFGFGFYWVGLPLPWLLGLMMGVLNLVPYLQMVGLVPVAILSLIAALQGGESFLVVGMSSLTVVLVVQVLQDMIIVPKVMGDASGLSPAVMLLSLSIWGKLLGFLGLVLAIPITCLLIVWYQRWVARQYSEDQAHVLVEDVN
jgi:predicted PurR-regulated permease PerM